MKKNDRRGPQGAVSQLTLNELPVSVWVRDYQQPRDVLRIEEICAISAVGDLETDHLLEIGSYSGVVSIAAAQNNLCASATVLATRADTIQSINNTLKTAPSDALRCIPGESLNDAGDAEYDTILVYQQQSRALTELWLRQAASMLSETGTLVVVGAAKSGIRPSEDLLESLCASVRIHEVRSGVRVLLGKGPFQSSSCAVPREEHGDEIAGVDFQWVGSPGVFGREMMDPASRLLLETVVLPHKGKILDLGCGSGALGIWSARRMPGVQVTMVDVSVSAVRRAQEGIELNGLTNADVLLSDGTDALEGKRFNVVISNPPMHIHGSQDHRITERFVRMAAQAVGRKGRLWMVTAPTAPVRKLLTELFTEVRIAVDSGPFRVYDAIRRPLRQAEKAW